MKPIPFACQSAKCFLLSRTIEMIMGQDISAVSPWEFISFLQKNDIRYFTGVPDSLLKNFVGELERNRGNPDIRHIICADEGQSVAIAAGWHLATRSFGCVYMQNSGLGNAINPLLSIADPYVYSIPMLLVIGWRGEPCIADEPQHTKQGEVTLSLLEAMRIPYKVMDVFFWQNQINELIKSMREYLCPVALVVKKGSFDSADDIYDEGLHTQNLMLREEALACLLKNIGHDDLLISTTGKTSREIFELSQLNHRDHAYNFLNIGGMGHTSSLAFGLSEGVNRRVWCIDGDGAMLMHFGSLAVIAQNLKNNYRYVVNVNGVHESVGGQPNAAGDIKIVEILRLLGFDQVFEGRTNDELTQAVIRMINCEKSALVIYTMPGSRKTLGRPTTAPLLLKQFFMEKIEEGQ